MKIDNSELELHSFIYSKITRPQKAIADLFRALSAYGTPFTLERCEKFNFSSELEGAGVILMRTGVYSVCHAESDLFVASGFGESIIGFIDSYSLFYDIPFRPAHYVFAETNCVGYFVKLADFLMVVDSKQLWHDVSRILAHRLMVMSIREQELVGVDSYTMIRSILIEVWNYPESYRHQINILNIVQRRTKISKSRIMKILSELRKGNYIVIQKGRLENINSLPKAF